MAFRKNNFKFSNDLSLIEIEFTIITTIIQMDMQMVD